MELMFKQKLFRLKNNRHMGKTGEKDVGLVISLHNNRVMPASGIPTVQFHKGKTFCLLYSLVYFSDWKSAWHVVGTQ